MENVATPRARLVRRVMIDLALLAVIGVVLAFVGPFGTYMMPLGVRLVLWPLFSWVGYAFYRPMGPIVNHLHRTLDLPVVALWAGACMISTVPMATCIYLLDVLPDAPRVPSFETGLAYYFNVLVIGGGITAIMQLTGRNRPEPVADEVIALSKDPPEDVPEDSPSPVDALTPFLDRLPPALGTQLLALEMEDHYVRAHTAAGSDLVLMRMRDAVAELDGLEGAQVHRSWWVAREAVEGTRRDGRNVRLLVSGGLEAPVARGNVAELKARGWL